MSDEKPKSSCSSICLYRAILQFKLKLKTLNKKLSGAMDCTLSEIGYSSLFVSYILKTYSAKSVTAPRLKSLYSMISDFRMFLRMWGTPELIEWALDELAGNKDKDFISRWIAYLQALSGLFYQLLENVAYLSSKNVIPLSANTEGKIWIYSCYMWALYVQLDLLLLLKNKINGKKGLLKPFFVNMMWLPLTVHWSTPTGFLDDGAVGFLGAAATLPGFMGKYLS